MMPRTQTQNFRQRYDALEQRRVELIARLAALGEKARARAHAAQSNVPQGLAGAARRGARGRRVADHRTRQGLDADVSSLFLPPVRGGEGRTAPLAARR
jgi:hypothetical protein